MIVLQTLLMLSVTLLLCSGARLPRQSSDDDDDDDDDDIVSLLPNTDSCGLSGVRIQIRAIGGRSAELKELPWMAALGYETSESKDIQWNCGGSLITVQHVLTAAHCVDPYTIRPRSLIKVRLGELDLNETVQDGAQPQDIAVGDTIVHEQYNMWKMTNDIAIIKMKTNVTFTDFIRPICLSPEVFATNDYEGHHPNLAGWGKNFVDVKAVQDTHLKVVDVEIQSIDYCRNNLPHNSVFGNKTIDSRVICAYSSGKDACEGDSGGPLMMPIICRSSADNDTKPDNGWPSVNYFLMGIVSYGPPCTSKSQYEPGVYTNVSTFMSWIVEHLDFNNSI